MEVVGIRDDVVVVFGPRLIQSVVFVYDFDGDQQVIEMGSGWMMPQQNQQTRRGTKLVSGQAQCCAHSRFHSMGEHWAPMLSGPTYAVDPVWRWLVTKWSPTLE